MEFRNLNQKYKHIIDNMNDYALVKNSRGGHVLFSIKNQGFVMIDDNGELFRFLLAKGIKVVNDEREAVIVDHVHYVQIWDEEEKKWVMIPEKEIEKYIKSKSKK